MLDVKSNSPAGAGHLEILDDMIKVQKEKARLVAEPQAGPPTFFKWAW